MSAALAIKDGRLLEDRRKLGAFYTPERLSQILSNWVIRSGSDTVLEPSFGGCGFLQAARNRLSALGCASPRSQIYGCDIDPVAFDYLANTLGSPVDLMRFIQSDFWPWCLGHHGPTASQVSSPIRRISHIKP